MANGYFVVQNGLQVGPLTIDAASGTINTSGNVNITGNLGVSSISKNDSSIVINDTGSGSNITFGIDGVVEHLMTGTLTTLNTALTATGNIVAAATTSSTSTTTGALVVNGGVGIAGALNAGSISSPTAALTTLASTNFTSANAHITGSDTNIGANHDNSISRVNLIVGTTGDITTLVAPSFSSSNAQVTGTGSYFGTGASLPSAVYSTTGYHTNFSAANIAGVTNAALSTLVATNFSTGNAQITGTGSYFGTGASLVNSVYGTTGYFTNFSSANIDQVTNMDAITSVATNLSTGNIVATGGSINNVTVGATTATAGRFTTVTATTVNAGTIGNTGAILTGTLSTAAQTNITSVGTLTSLAVGAVTSSGTVIASTVQAGTIGNSGATLTGTLSTAAQTNVTSVGTLTGLTVGGATQVNSTLGVTGVTQITNATNSTGANSGALQVTGGASFGGNVYIGGNLEIAGTQTTFNTNNVIVDDSILYIADSNSGDSVDIGFVGHFTNPGYQHTGFVRDASDGVWKLFSGVVAEPTTTVDFTSATYAALKTGAITSSGTVIASTVNAGTIGNSGATLTGTLSTAAQTNITSVGTLTSLSVSGALSAGSFTVPTAAQPNITSVGTLTGLTVSGAIVPNANLTINVGSVSAWFNTFYGVSTQAKYADLAENYQADKAYAPGTVLMFGGAQEVTVADAETTRVAGVVSTNPAHLMNGQLTGASVVPLALQGRVPCNVIGPVQKGDMMVSAGFGYAKASTTPAVGQVIGKALSDFTGAKGQIEVVVGRV